MTGGVLAGVMTEALYVLLSPSVVVLKGLGTGSISGTMHWGWFGNWVGSMLGLRRGTGCKVSRWVSDTLVQCAVAEGDQVGEKQL